jgi:hypothetical protein
MKKKTKQRFWYSLQSNSDNGNQNVSQFLTVVRATPQRRHAWQQQQQQQLQPPPNPLAASATNQLDSASQFLSRLAFARLLLPRRLLLLLHRSAFLQR